MNYVMANGDGEGVVVVDDSRTDAVLGSHANSHRDKLIIDTDPGIGELFFYFFYFNNIPTFSRHPNRGFCNTS